jgi:hypothetical protein
MTDPAVQDHRSALFTITDLGVHDGPKRAVDRVLGEVGLKAAPIVVNEGFFKRSGVFNEPLGGFHTYLPMVI